MSPMCMYSCENGVPNDFHLVHYGSRAQGGTGLIIVEATSVVPEGRITNKCTGIWNDEQAEEFRKIVKFVHDNSESKIGIQLAHAGRKASTWNGKQLPLNEGWETVAASAIPYMEGERIPHELSLTEIAHKLNYSSVAHLSTQFKNTTGITPSQFHKIITRRRKIQSMATNSKMMYE